MAMFQSFRAAPKEDPVDLIQAEIAKAQAEATQLRDRNTNILGAGLLYNKGMGDKSPIYDAVFGAEKTAPITDSAFTNSMATDSSLSSSLFGDAASLSGETALAEGGVNDALISEIMGGAGEVGTNLGVEGALNMGTDLASNAAMDASMMGADAALAGGTEAALATQALSTAATETALAGGAEAGLTGMLGAAGSAIPPLLMAALLSRALGLWS